MIVAALPMRALPQCHSEGILAPRDRVAIPASPRHPRGQSPVLPGVPRSPLSRGGALRTAGDLPRGSDVGPDAVHYNAGLVHALAEG